MLPILINYKVIHYTLTYWEIIISMIIPKHIAYSPTCLTVETDDKHRYWQFQTQYCWGRLLLCSSGCKQICGTQNRWSNFSENLRIVTLKLIKLTRSEEPNQSIYLNFVWCWGPLYSRPFSMHCPFIEKSMC